MSYNLERTEQVRHLLAHIPDVEEKKMFGSIGFMVNGKMSLGVGDHEDHNMMVRVGPDAYEGALKRKGAVPAIMRGKEMKGYVFITEEGLQSEKDVEDWVTLALDFNRKLTKS